MTKSNIVLALLISMLLSALGGYFFGTYVAENVQAAKFNAETVKRLTDVITTSETLTADAALASQAMRKIINARIRSDAITTKDLQDALKATADSRSGCRFDDGIMQQLAAARERAADSAANGLRNTATGTD